MARLLIHVEGETEEMFVNEVLAPHLYNVGWEIVSARIVGNARLRERRGGIKAWSVVRGDIIRHLRACLKMTRGTAATELTGATDKGPAARRVFGEKAVWLRCSSVEDPRGIFSFVAPRHPAFSPKTAPRVIFRQALKEDPRCYATTMVDFYALPQGANTAWPGRAAAALLPTAQKAPHVEAQLDADLQQAMGPSFQAARFIPFVVMHEFEALLFSDCEAFSRGIGRPDLRAAMQNVRDGFATPEEINDSPQTAPSKRVEALIPNYQKPLLGTFAALEVGLRRIREECPHFAAWLTRLEQIVR